MPNSPVDQLTEVLDGYERVLAGVGDDQWTMPTPCTEWTVRDVANHLQGGNRLVTEILVGDEPELRRGLPEADLLGDKPVAAFRDLADAMLVAFGQPGVLERIVVVPVGSVPGVGALYLRLVEHLVHGWDLATATGQKPEFDEEITAQALAFTEAKLADLPASNTAFAPRKPVPANGSALDRLVALLGRDAG